MHRMTPPTKKKKKQPKKPTAKGYLASNIIQNQVEKLRIRCAPLENTLC
jgi:hypothetical protein